MSSTKECIMCFSKIDTRAKKCPICQSSQVKFSNLETSPIFFGVVVVFHVVLFGYLGYEIYFAGKNENRTLGELEITVLEHSTIMEGETLYVACMGAINNTTKYKFKEAKFASALSAPQPSRYVN